MRRSVIVLITCSLLLLTGCASKTGNVNTTSSSKAKEVVSKESSAKVVDEYAGMQAEEVVIRKRIKEKYDKTDVTDIKLNPDLGTDAPDDLVALVYLTWNVQNTGKTSKEMLKMYSDDLAATVAESCPKLQEIAIFWTVPYLNDNAKCSYERKNGGMYEMDMMWGSAFK